MKGTNVRKLHTVILEDDVVLLQLLRSYVARIPELGPVEFFTDPVQALETLRSKAVDLLLLDIGLPGISGFQLLERLPSKPHVIIITADADHALEGFEQGAVDLLLKPFTLERLLRSVHRATGRSKNAGNAALATTTGPGDRPVVLSLRSGRSTLRIPARSILMAEALGNYVKLHLNDRVIIVNSTLKTIEKQLPPDLFVRVHRSYIVSLSSIRDIHQDTLFTGHGEVPVGATYRKAVMERQDISGPAGPPTGVGQ